MDDHTHPMDHFGDERRPPLIIDGQHSLIGTHQGSVCVHDGAELEVLGTQQGSLSFRPGSVGKITGTSQGSLHVGPNSTVDIEGRQRGSVHVEYGGFVRVAHGARLSGSLHVEGVIENHGTRGGTVSGNGQILDLDGATVQQPTVRDGINYYDG